MTAIALRLSNAKFFGWPQRRYAGADLKSLSDKNLEDIGFKLVRRDLSPSSPSGWHSPEERQRLLGAATCAREQFYDRLTEDDGAATRGR